MPVLCPDCGVALTSARTPYGLGWLCLRCQGRAANLSVMRRALREPFMREVWRQTREGSPHALMASSAPCPSCRKLMRSVNVKGDVDASVLLAVCPSCQMAWMAADQIGGLPRQVPEEPQLSAEARELLAVAEAEARHQSAREDRRWAPPDGWWRTMLTILDFPTEEGAPPLLHRAWATWAAAAAMTAVTAWAMLGPGLEAVIAQWGFLPGDPFRHGGLDWLTSFFLHGGILHLLVNGYFLLVFGDNVEGLLGRPRYLALILAAQVTATSTHLLVHAHNAPPLVGASGAISGILAFYALALPRVRLVFSLARFGWVWILPSLLGKGWFRLSARWALAAWVAIQLIGVWTQFAGFSNVSALAHLGGAAAGATAWWLWRSPRDLNEQGRNAGTGGS